jgi:predicted RecA/RadA family phage recombinase
MTNYIQEGKTIQVATPAGGYTSGDLVKVGELVGIAVNTTLEGETAVISLEGVYEVPKVGSQAQAIGVILYFDESEGHVTTATDSGTNRKAGYAHVAAGADDTTVMLLLER